MDDGRLDSNCDARLDAGTLRPLRQVHRSERRRRDEIAVAGIVIWEAERGGRSALRLLRIGVVPGVLAAAWRIGLVIGQW
jgi:hypothetical protein